MKVFKRKSAIQRLGKSMKSSLDPSANNRSLSGMSSAGKALKGALPNNGKALKAGLPDKDKALKAGGIAAGGLTALTAVSAGISSLRRRREGASDDS